MSLVSGDDRGARPRDRRRMTDVSVTPQQPAPPAPEPHRHRGWLIVLGVVGVLALGGLAAAVISRGDDGTETTSVPYLPTVQRNTTINAQPATTVEKTVTTPPSTVTVEPQVTIQGPQQGATGP